MVTARRWGAVVAAMSIASGMLVLAAASPASASTTTSVTIDAPTTLVPSPATLGSIVFVAPDEGGPDQQPSNVFVTITANPAGSDGSPAGVGSIAIGFDPSAPLQDCDATYSTPFCEWAPNSDPGITATLGLTLTPSSDAAGNFTLTVGVDDLTDDPPVTFTQQLSIGEPAGAFAASVTTTSDTQQRPDAAVVQYSCDNGYAGQVSVPPGQTTASTGALLVPGATRCTTEVVDDGAASGTQPSLASTLSVNGGMANPLGDGVAVESGSAYQVAYTYTFADLGAAVPSAGPTTPSRVPRLPATGLDATSTAVLTGAGIALVVGGLLLAGWARRRRRP